MIFAGKTGVLVYLFLMHEMNAHSFVWGQNWAELREVRRNQVQTERDATSKWVV